MSAGRDAGLVLLLLGAVAACGADAPRPSANVHQATPERALPRGHHAAADAPASDVDARLAEVARAHGGAGPWAVAGYRMGAHALTTLGLPRGSFDLEIVHYTPHEVQYACIADGASAATGATVGKLNLSLKDAPAPDTRTTYRNRKSGSAVTLRITHVFAKRFLEVPRERLGAAGREAMELPDRDVFEVMPEAN